MRIVVLNGGVGGERQVSLSSGERVTAALRERGEEVLRFDYKGALFPQLVSEMKRADAVFLALHGEGGEDGCLQRKLEGEGIFHYTGSGPQGSALAMDKAKAKERVRKNGVPVAEGAVWLPQSPRPALPFPLVVKPLSGGSSIGFSLWQTESEQGEFAPLVPMLCEAYLSGREYTVGVLSGRALPVVEIRPRGGLYDYAHKYAAHGAEELCPAPISEEKARELQGLALAAVRALRLRDVARIDFKEDGLENPVFLEANTLPGMTKTSLLPLAAEVAGIPFGDLCLRLCALAQKRKKKSGCR